MSIYILKMHEVRREFVAFLLPSSLALGAKLQPYEPRERMTEYKVTEKLQM